MHGKLGYVTLALSFLSLCFVPMCWSQSNRARPRERARAILNSTGCEGGIVVHLGCGQGRLTAALHRGDAYLVRGLDADQEQIEAARRYIRSRGLYGKVSVAHWEAQRLPFTDNLVNLVVAEASTRISISEMMRVLAPGGVAYVEKEEGSWSQKRKPWPAEIDEWSHFLHDASNNAVARDSRVGPPRQLQWKATPMWCRSHEFASSVNALVSARGRLFGIIDEGLAGQPRGVPAQWTLVARDAFNGTLLWKRPASRTGARSLVAHGNKVYVTLERDGPVSILDAATGETLATCQQTSNTKELIHVKGTVVCRVQDKNEQRRSGKKGEQLVAVDGQTGKVRWNRLDTVASNTLAAGNGRVCYHSGDQLVALHSETGEESWSTSAGGSGGYVVMYEDIVLLTGNRTTAFSASSGEKLWTAGGLKARSIPGVFIADGLIWSAWTRGGEPYEADWREVPSRGRFAAPRGLKIWEPKKALRKGYDPQTGEVRRTVAVERLVTPGHHIRCYPPKATERYLLLNKRGVEFLDIKGENSMRHDWVRAPCHYGVMPANGLLYMPPHQCFCYPGVLLNGFNALTSRTSLEPRSSGEESSGEENRLFRGPAWGTGSREEGDFKEGTDKAWPTYRHDPRRSGSVAWSGPSAPRCLWETELGGNLSPPVAADGKVFVASTDSHAVHCLDANSGKRLWTRVAGARVDSPPTIHEGRVLFGSADGHVYCLRVSDGELIWRFRAAPGINQISVRGQIESAWPAHGSVLVRDDKAYVTAGRSSHLEGGIWMYALDPATGEVSHQHQLKDPAPDVSKDAGRPFDMDGARSDILVAGQRDIYLLQNRFNADLSPVPMPTVTKLGDRQCERHLMATGGFLDRHRSNGAFNRMFWTYSNRWPGFYFAYEAPKAGQILVFDERTTYAVKYYAKRHGHSPEFTPGSGYKLFADRNTNDPVLRPPRAGQEKGGGFSREQFWKWFKEVPVRVEAMVLAGERLYLAGPPDIGPGKEAAEDAMQGRKGSRFWVISASDGKNVSVSEMEKAPVFDGLIAAFGRLYMASQDGTLMCLGNKQDEESEMPNGNQGE
ncbi:MAG: PQQ-binding-like beta-propeller repeat protein [Planctomycetota bacterium]